MRGMPKTMLLWLLRNYEVLSNNNYRNASFGSPQKPSNSLHPIELTQLWATPQPLQQIAFGGVDGTNSGEQIRMTGQNQSRRKIQNEALIENCAFLCRRNDLTDEVPELAAFSFVQHDLLGCCNRMLVQFVLHARADGLRAYTVDSDRYHDRTKIGKQRGKIGNLSETRWCQC